MANKTIIVMNDSHDDREIINDIKTEYQGEVDAIFHGGDSELPSSNTIWEGIKVVRSNCDYDDGYPERLITYLGNVVVAQAHDHLYSINFTWDRLDLFTQEAGADIHLYGHLRRPATWRNDKMIFINPGSILQPRGDVKEKLYARVDIAGDKIRTNYYTRNRGLFPALSRKFNR